MAIAEAAYVAIKPGLRAGLSEYLQLVQQGETVLVTVGDEVIATMSPPPISIPADQPFARMIARGEASPPLLPKAGWTWRPRSLNLPPGTVEGLLDELRKDSWEP